MKRILSPADLAINGAEPAFGELLHVGHPNMGRKAAFQDLVDGMFESRWLTNNGPLVQDLEHRISTYLGVRNCVAICNGTIALEIAIRALGLGGEVIVPSYTFIATAHALHWHGVKPVFVDIDPATHNLDPEAVRDAITDRTTGIVSVHLWGRPAPVEALQRIADGHGLPLLFDAAHAFGCSHDGRMIGNFGRAEVFSFHATKFFNTFEGGAIVTNDDALAADMRLMRNFGFAGFDNVICPGTNGKMPEICAAMGLVNLEGVDAFVAANQRNYEAYREGLSDVKGLRLLEFDPAERNNYQYIVVEVDPVARISRDRLLSMLFAENVIARRYFWPGCHGMKAYRERFPDAGSLLPATEAVAERVLVLPNGTTLPDGAVETICAVLRQAMDGG